MAPSLPITLINKNRSPRSRSLTTKKKIAQKIEICKRTPKKVHIYSEYFSCSDIFELEKENIKKNFNKIFCGGNEEFTDWQEDMQEAILFERGMLWFEVDVKDRLEEMSNFSDRTKTKAPYDLIEDLDEIDEIMFGEKHTRPHPSFSFKIKKFQMSKALF